ncbi:acyltransferase family protein [Polynucleobacter necessarius]|uniref:acyltransferase family protein n=1 Tax=Polynucleobacter necessarius TaxID=576610 RepID=UPI001E32E6F6|nr:acyltransferase [Polynucleobacter necessarius]
MHPQYRPDIDGLRAIAVLSVVIFHAFPDLMPGGFIGVDIFFVISGFLICTIIFGNLKQNSFSIINFYLRRIRRIFPALIIVLISSWAIAWFALLPEEFKSLGKYILGGAGFVSNLVLWNESGYFDAFSNSKPLLHLWSLGIEEQFYLIWPLLMWPALRMRITLINVTVAILIISFTFNITFISSASIAIFYSPITRVWELLLGAVLAWLLLSKQQSGKTPAQGSIDSLNLRQKNVLASLGLASSALSLILISEASAFPGWVGSPACCWCNSIAFFRPKRLD